jgi:ribonuclease III
MTKKRKSANDPIHSSPNKKTRYDNGAQDSTATKPDQVSTNLPPLPPISQELSKSVFTHRSAVHGRDVMNQSANYERLEFLGDAYIEVMASRLIWDHFKDLPAGRLSQIRESLVKNETLGSIARMYGLDKRLAVAHDVRSNPKLWAKIKGDLLEAYVAAIVLTDQDMVGAGFATAEKWLHQVWTPRLKGMLEEKAPDLNAKVELSRKIVSRGIKLEYLYERPMELLEGGQQTHFIAVFLTGWGHDKRLLGRGQGLSKTAAGNLAAATALRNPLIDDLVESKREFDQANEDRRRNEGSADTEISSHDTKESETRERGQAEKRRSMFLSSELA